jgi:uncharacterized RDD family membrane protein YckC
VSTQPPDDPGQYGYGQPGGAPPPPPAYGQPPQGYGQPAPAAVPYKGSELGLPPTGPNSLASQWMRLVARIIDIIILAIPGFIVAGALLSDSDAAYRPGMTPLSGDLIAVSLVTLLIGAAYEVGMLVTQGATVGKMALGMRVARIADGQKPTPADAVTRWAVPNVAGLVPFLGGLFQIVNALWCLWDPNRQCLHDKVAKTVVVSTK